VHAAGNSGERRLPYPIDILMHHDQSFQILRDSLAEARRQALPTAAFCAIWRGQHALLAALPERYRAVMEDVLGRLEAGSLFTEESCSFSQQDLYSSLSVWIDKAQQTLHPSH
jgi:hypothetical protein